MWHSFRWYALVLSNYHQLPTCTHQHDTAVPIVAYAWIYHYCVLLIILGLFADAFIGRYRLIQFSLWIQWITVLMSTFTVALSEYLNQVHEWVQSLLISIIIVMELLGSF